LISVKLTWRRREEGDCKSVALTKVITSKSLAESNDNLIGFIAGNVEKLRDDVTSMRAQMVTKSAFEAAVTTVRGDIEQVHLRLNMMDHSVSSRFEQVRKGTQPSP
jgi:hypothetical protein